MVTKSQIVVILSVLLAVSGCFSEEVETATLDLLLATDYEPGTDFNKIQVLVLDDFGPNETIFAVLEAESDEFFRADGLVDQPGNVMHLPPNVISAIERTRERREIEGEGDETDSDIEVILIQKEGSEEQVVARMLYEEPLTDLVENSFGILRLNK